ncbi:MAG: DUF1573 domain-containing protein [Candidatus Omnitrophica bacterium]|nr:DUF1573 domain-containing protein [Candidatus Omnitrophota bacterium]MBU1924119.1 DUF1573 domain-containing protein [Candidatus Omnitrophota bacterium]
MRKILLFTLCFLFCFSMGLAQPDQGDANTWDFGKIRVSEGIVKHVFSLKNDSDVDLNISGTHASCGCTVLEIDKKVILPKETANLEVKFNPKGYSGQVIQYVYVNTDSKTTPVDKFIIKADVHKD